MLLATLAGGCNSPHDKNDRYYTNRYAFGCYSASDLDEAVGFMNSGRSDLFRHKLRKTDDAECLELKPGFEVCILEEGRGDKIRIGACGEKEGLWAQKSSISKTREQAMSMPDMLPAAVEGKSNNGGSREIRDQLIQKSLADGSVCRGMTNEQVELVWGHPERQRKIFLLSNEGRKEGIEWFYGDGASAVFINGEVTRTRSTAARKVCNQLIY